jgi:hypothetical protein
MGGGSMGGGSMGGGGMARGGIERTCSRTMLRLSCWLVVSHSFGWRSPPGLAAKRSGGAAGAGGWRTPALRRGSY